MIWMVFVKDETSSVEEIKVKIKKREANNSIPKIGLVVNVEEKIEDLLVEDTSYEIVEENIIVYLI